MAAGFNPYHRWFSIPPAEQPPDHYRLLGLQVFESSYEVIENAAARQSRHVRGHLETPMRPYAMNLLREIEIARLCLLDREAKSAYDSCLRQRQEYQGPTDATKVSRTETDDWSPRSSPAESISFSAPPAPTIQTYGRLHRQRRRSSPLAFLVLWLSGGAMGLLAGYAILCMIDRQYDFLHVMFPEEPTQQSEVAIARLPPTTKTSESSPRPRPTMRPQIRPRRTPSPADDGGVAELEQPLSTGDQREREPQTEVPRGRQPPKNQPQAVDALKPVVLPFEFKKRVLRVIYIPETESFEELRCNIHGSPELHMNPLIDFPLGGKQEVILNNSVGGVIAGFEVSFLRRNKAVIVEISPKYRLPSGDEEGWYKVAGVKKGKLLARQVSEATNARKALPSLRSALGQVNVRIDSVSQVAYTPTTAAHTMRQTAAQRSLGELTGQRNELQAQIGAAEVLSTNLPNFEADFAAVKLLGEWSAEIAETATLSVCIHKDGTGLVAEAK